MCGIIGIVGHNDVAAQLYDGLTVLQHRGQDAAGIATANGTRLRVHKGNGLVRDVFDEARMSMLRGHVGIAHVRYPTAGSAGMDEAQPFYVNSPYGIALAHNGNLINTEALRQQVFEADRRNINTDSEATMYSSPASVWRLPSTSGRMPCGSRKATRPRPSTSETTA